MKKSFILLIALLFVGITTQAQLKYGLKAGVNLSSVSINDEWSDVVDAENLTGFQVGPMIEFTVPIIGIGLDAAVLYSQQGFKVKDYGETETFKTNTLDVPVNFKYKINLVAAGAYLSAGPYARFNLSDNLSEEWKDKTFGAGLNFGVGVELLSKLQIGVNYQLGLTDDFSAKMDTDDIPGLNLNLPDMTGKTRVWSITAAYFF